MGFKIQTDKHYLIKVSQDNGHWEPEIVKERVAKFLKYTRINFVNYRLTKDQSASGHV